jgi:thioredoxin reductase (NADPH)
MHTQMLIIGSGPAGYTAAIYAARANLKPHMVCGLQKGGQLTITTDVENYPGFADVIQGPWLMDQMHAQAAHVGTTFHTDYITEVDFDTRPFVCKGSSGTVYTADTVVIATGASARWLDLPSEDAYRGFGISACATCDGFFFKDVPVAVIGGGSAAVEEALFLTNHASHVTLVHRRDELRAEKVLQERLLKHPKISVAWNRVVDEFVGITDPHKALTGVRLNSTVGEDPVTLDVEGAFVAIGHDPATSLFKSKLNMDDGGYILAAPNSTATNIPGVFAAGDVQDKVYRQAVTAAGQGCMAALEAERYLSALDD